MQNWAGNLEFTAGRTHEPRSVDEVREIVQRADTIRALGTRHSFNDIADCPAGELISTRFLDRVIEIDRGRLTVTVEAGITYGKLAVALHREGFALENLASLPHISVGGAIATGTHGSGVRLGSLATAVEAIELIDATGEVRQLSRETIGERFYGAVVALGALGVVTKSTLTIAPVFEIAQRVFLDVPMAIMRDSFEEIVAGAYSVSLFTDWKTGAINQIWFKNRANETFAVPLENPTPATRNMHPIASLDAQNCTQQLGVPGPSHERLPHFRMEFTPSAGEELQSEYFIARSQAIQALGALLPLRSRIAELIQITEIRTIAADPLWLSPCFERDSVAFHFTWKKDWSRVRELLPQIEAALAPFEARPHWGKLFTMDSTHLQSLYPKLDDFRNLRRAFDPRRKFMNPFLQKIAL